MRYHRPGIPMRARIHRCNGEPVRNVALHVSHFEQVESVDSRHHNVAEGTSIFGRESERKELSPCVAGHYVGHTFPFAPSINVVVTRDDKVDPVFDKELVQVIPRLSEDVEAVKGQCGEEGLVQEDKLEAKWSCQLGS